MPVSIRSRLLLLALAALLPMVVIALWVVGQTYAAERQALRGNLRDTTRALSLVVDRELAQRATIARVLALSLSSEAAPDLASALPSFDRQARLAIAGLAGSVELHAAEELLIDTSLPRGSAPRKRKGGAALLEEAVVGPLQASPDDGALRAAVVQPVRRDGQTLLNLAVTIRPGELQQIIDSQQLPGDWVAVVLDEQGTVVARHPGGIVHAGRQATDDMKRNIRTRNEGDFESVSLDGRPTVGYFSRSPRGWTYVTAMPRPGAWGRLPSAVVQLVLLAWLLLGMAAAGALWLSRRIVTPVLALKEAAARMKAGEAVVYQPTGIVECNEVAQALADASEAMRNARAELARQVSAAVALAREAEQRVSQRQRVEALGRLTGAVAHDFNNLLGVISNSAYLVERRAQAADLQAPVAAILRSVEVGSRLTQHLLRFGGRQSTHPVAIEPGSYLRDLRELLQIVVGKSIKAVVAVAPDTLPITMDPNELELALINLALNARDAMPRGGHVWIEARNAADEDAAGLAAGRYVLISVTDDGVGMAPELARRVFEPFFSTKPAGGGTGLGLSQVYGLCVQAGGLARVSSTPRLGTTVAMLLPARDPAAAETAADDPAAARPTPAPSALALSGLRVLLVEDNDELAEVTAVLLGAYGGSVTRARHPAAALALLGTSPAFDVVLSDVAMPGDMDGLALARHLRGQMPRLPVVLISGYSEALASAQDFTVLRKPCAPLDLITALRAAMDGSAGSARAAGTRPAL